MDLEKNQPEEESNLEHNDQHEQADENATADQFYFPEKPLTGRSENPMLRSVLSLLFFVGIFYLLFGDLQYVLLVVVVLLVHEAGHLTAMKIFGYKELSMLFIPMLGAAVTGEKRRISQRQRVIILLAGPIPGIILGVIFAYLSVTTGNENYGTIASVFILLNAFNLLPFTPLDGGKVIETLFFSNKEIMKMVFLAISCAAMIVLGFLMQSYLLVLFGALWIGRIRNENKLRGIRAKLREQGLNYEQHYDDLSDKEYWLIRKTVLEEQSNSRLADPSDFRPTNREPIIITHIKQVLQIAIEQDLSPVGKAIWVLLWFGSLVGTIAAIIYVAMGRLIEDAGTMA